MTEKNIIPFIYNESPIRVVKDDAGEPWFVAKDICAVLEHANPTVAVGGLDDDERCLRKVYPPERPEGVDVNTISESGLYTLVIRSNKQQAKVFRRWVTHEVLPALRKSGVYALGADQFADQQTTFAELVGILGRTASVIERLEQRLNDLDRKAADLRTLEGRFIPEPDAPADFFEFRKHQMDKISPDVRRFLIAKTMIDKEASSMLSWLYSTYEQWCFANCTIPQGRNTFYADLRMAVSGYGEVKTTRKSQLYITGIRLREKE